MVQNIGGKMSKSNKKYGVTECLFDILEKIYPTPPKIKELKLSQKARLKLWCYINLVGEYEITGFGKIEDGVITDVRILKQKVKSTTVDCNQDAMNEFLLSIPAEERGLWILDWHSHVNMNTFYSGTDTNNYEEQWKARLKEQYPIMVVNKRDEYTINQYVNPNRMGDIKLEREDITLSKEEIEEIYNQCKEDVETLCSREEYYITADNNGQWYKPKETYTIKDKYWGKNKEEKKRQLSMIDNCISCGCELSYGEIERGICDDCWEQMTWYDRNSWIEKNGLPKYLLY